MGVFLNEDYHNISVQIVDNSFQNNYARSFGGAVFLVVFNEGTRHALDLERNTFNLNFAVLGAGALLMTFISNGIREDPHITRVADCLFQNNSAASGGAIFVYAATLQGMSIYLYRPLCRKPGQPTKYTCILLNCIPTCWPVYTGFRHVYSSFLQALILVFVVEYVVKTLDLRNILQDEQLFQSQKN